MASSSSFSASLSKDEKRKFEFRLSARDDDAPPPCPPYPGKKNRTGHKGLLKRNMLI